jgi:hypothetical protein
MAYFEEEWEGVWLEQANEKMETVVCHAAVIIKFLSY